LRRDQEHIWNGKEISYPLAAFFHRLRYNIQIIQGYALKHQRVQYLARLALYSYRPARGIT
jgi:hypothetical protein